MDILVVINIFLLGALVLLLVLYLRGRNRDLPVSDAGISPALLRDGLDRVERGLRDEISRNRDELRMSVQEFRMEIGGSMQSFGESIGSSLGHSALQQKDQLDLFTRQLGDLTRTTEEKLSRVRDGVEAGLARLREENNARLEQMRETVDEKLHATLEQRLGQSFKLVSERLEQVHKGLGEMQTLASGVGDLKRVLTNVRVRGTWGEFQLGTLLEQVLSPEQYVKNVATKPGSNDRVEFALKLPGRDVFNGKWVWLPIDAKFPQEDYQRLLDAQEQANAIGAEDAGKSLEQRLKLEARNIRDKYLDPPHTTDFAILFLPVEGLYAEVLRRPGLAETLQREFRVVITGPTTLAALLNSLQMGFRTLAIEKRSSEVWSLLGAVKTEFGRFGDILDKTQKKLQEASNTIENAARKTRTIEQRLKDVQVIPAQESLGFLDAMQPEENEPEEE